MIAVPHVTAGCNYILFTDRYQTLLILLSIFFYQQDDYFLLSRGMTVVETSITVFNTSLYAALTPQSVPVWIRSQLANRLAVSSPSWATVSLLQMRISARQKIAVG